MNEETKKIEQKNNLKEKNDSYYERNKAKIKLQQKMYYQKHKKKLITKATKYYTSNKDVILEKNKTSDRKKEYDRRYYLKNKARIRQRKKYLYKQNQLREQMKAKVNN